MTRSSYLHAILAMQLRSNCHPSEFQRSDPNELPGKRNKWKLAAIDRAVDLCVRVHTPTPAWPWIQANGPCPNPGTVYRRDHGRDRRFPESGAWPFPSQAVFSQLVPERLFHAKTKAPGTRWKARRRESRRDFSEPSAPVERAGFSTG